MDEFHILTLAGNLPLSMLNRVLTATEQALEELGVSKVWITSEGRNLKVVTDVPVNCGDVNDVAPPDCSLH